MTTSEFSRVFDVRQVEGRTVRLVAGEAERAALAERFGLVRIDRLEADLALDRKDDMAIAAGKLTARIVQSCAVSAEDLPVSIGEDVSFRFVPAAGDHDPDEEIEIDASDCDEIEYTGTQFDLGEAVAQSLALAIDPFAAGPQADEARALLRDEDASPFAALKGMKLKD